MDSGRTTIPDVEVLMDRVVKQGLPCHIVAVAEEHGFFMLKLEPWRVAAHRHARSRGPGDGQGMGAAHFAGMAPRGGDVGQGRRALGRGDRPSCASSAFGA
jgi:hypothetical protein